MVKITLVTSNPREVDIVPETMTVREFLEKHNVNYATASTSIDGFPLQAGGMDMSFADHQVTDRAVLSCIGNKDNGANAVIMGSSCIVKSELTPEQIDRVKKLHPEALMMYDKDTNEPVFAIDIDHDGPGSINDNGACFGSAVSADGKATITVLLDPESENVEELVLDRIGKALYKLNEMEKTVLESIPKMDEEEAAIKAMIKRM